MLQTEQAAEDVRCREKGKESQIQVTFRIHGEEIVLHHFHQIPVGCNQQQLTKRRKGSLTQTPMGFVFFDAQDS